MQVPWQRYNARMRLGSFGSSYYVQHGNKVVVKLRWNPAVRPPKFGCQLPLAAPFQNQKSTVAGKLLSPAKSSNTDNVKRRGKPIGPGYPFTKSRSITIK